MKPSLRLLALFLLSAAMPAGAATVAGRVSLFALQPDLRHLRPEQVTLTLTPLEAAVAAQRTEPDPGGRFRFGEVQPGRYELAASSPDGYGALTWITVGQEPYVCHLRLASAVASAAASALWALLALLVAGVFGASIVLYGTGRTRRQKSAPRSLTVGFLLWITAFCMYRVLSPEMQPFRSELAVGLSGVVAALLAGCVVAIVIELRPPWLAAAAALFAGIALSLASVSAALHPDLAAVGIGVGLLLWTTAAGWLLSLWLRRPSYLVLAAITIAIMDFYSVFHGFTGQVASGARPELQVLLEVGTLPWPILGADLVRGVIGLGDFLFLAWFLAAAARFELGVTRNYWVLMAAFTIGLVMTQALALAGLITHGLPALPFMSLLFLLANRGRFEISREERRLIATFVLLLLLVVAVLIGLKQRAAPREREEVVVAPEASPSRPPLRIPWTLALLRTEPAAVRLGPPLTMAGQRVEPVTLPAAPGSSEQPTGWLATPPPAPGGRPALLLLADSGQHQEAQRAAAWAAQGYVTLALHSPPASLAALLDANPSPLASGLYARGAGALRGLDYLTRRGGLNGRIIVMGEGWGGLLAIALGAIEPRVSGVVARGTGAVAADSGSAGRAWAGHGPAVRESWAAAYEPTRYAARLARPLLLVAGANDPRFSLEGVSRLSQEAATRQKRLLIVPNAEMDLTAADGTIARFVERLAKGSREPARELQVVARGREGDLGLALRGASVPGTAAVRFYLATGPGGWPGRFWSEVPARQDGAGWEAQVALGAAVEELPVFAEVAGPEGERCSSVVQSYRPGDLGLTFTEPGWAVPILASFDDGVEGWRLVGSRLSLRHVATDGGCLTAPPDAPQPTLLVTNQVDVLRRLGDKADGLELRGRLGAAQPWRVEIVSRYAQADERRVVATANPLPGGLLRLPFGSFRPAATVDWPTVDALVIKAPAGIDWCLEEIRLFGAAQAAVRPVTTP